MTRYPDLPRRGNAYFGWDAGDWRQAAAYELRRIAQNDYSIDGHALPDGEILEELAARIQEIQAIRLPGGNNRRRKA